MFVAIKASLILKKRESKIEAEDNLIHSGARKHGPKSVQKKKHLPSSMSSWKDTRNAISAVIELSFGVKLPRCLNK